MVVQVLRQRFHREPETDAARMARHSHQVLDNKGGNRGLLQRVSEAVGWSDGVKASVQVSDGFQVDTSTDNTTDNTQPDNP